MKTEVEEVFAEVVDRVIAEGEESSSSEIKKQCPEGYLKWYGWGCRPGPMTVFPGTI